MRGPVINALFLGLVLVTAVLLAALLVLGPRPSPPQAPVLTRGACAPCPACPTSPAALASPTADVRWLLVQRWLPSHGEALTVCASGADVFTGAPQPPSLSATLCHVTFVASVDQLGAGLERTRLGGLIVLLAPAGDKDWPWSNAVDEGRVEVLETLAGATPMRVGKRAEAIDNFALAAWKADKKRGDYEDLRRDGTRPRACVVVRAHTVAPSVTTHCARVLRIDGGVACRRDVPRPFFDCSASFATAGSHA